ncbi:chymotrypsin-like protease CTRL-1 [Toxorhynchites rutilus septentrionalis]|nr:chymotrypsin-like protease CTRL-1 [Toxorhynchites rutilus septentrionalis]
MQFGNRSGSLVGWNTAERLQSVQLSIVRCSGSDVSSKVFCAMSENATTNCVGDEGSGWFLNKNEVWTLYGVVSEPRKGCDYQQYLELANVATFSAWIKNKINQQDD